MASTTRTLNPLHFEDLEPHRFEDLVRQLAYAFRPWKSIEAIGRPGRDQGIDIRAVEGGPIVEGGQDDDEAVGTSEREWIFQCKREMALGPARVKQIMTDILPDRSKPPHGFVLAAACDFSKAARDVFREGMNGRGVEEAYVWGKGELEDLLCRPRNDHLLFAYFGLSLRVRRRSKRTEIRSRLATKQKLLSTFVEASRGLHQAVLVRDAAEGDLWLGEEIVPDFQVSPRWFFAVFADLTAPAHLLLRVRRHYANLAEDGVHWDAILEHNVSLEGPSRGFDRGPRWERREVDWQYHNYWNDFVPEENRAFLELYRGVPYDRIMAVDPVGDPLYEVPHIYVDAGGPVGPLSDREHRGIRRVGRYGGAEVPPDPGQRTAFFPAEIVLPDRRR
jgi:hypothetical protein